MLLRYLKGVPPPHEVWEHPTSNIELPTFIDCANGCHWVFEVGCGMLDVPLLRLRGSKRQRRHSGNSLPVSRFETNTPPRRPATASGVIFLHSDFFLLPSVGQSTCGAPRWTRATLVFTKSWQPVSRPHWESRGLDHLVQATAIHASRCAWVSVRQRLETVAKTPRIAHCAGLRGLYGTNAG